MFKKSWISKSLIILLVVVMFLFIINMFIKGTKATSLGEAQQALIDEAYAFYYRGHSLQYDSATISKITNKLGTDKVIMDRAAYFHQPEEATPQDIKYLFCSNFVNNVYYNTFVDSNNKNFEFLFNNESGNLQFMWYSSEMVDIANPDCINTTNNGTMNAGCHASSTSSAEYAYDAELAQYYKYFDYSSSITDSNYYGEGKQYASVKDAIKRLIQPGDFVAYKRESGGHVFLYLGDLDSNNQLIEQTDPGAGKTLESTADNYNYQYDTKREWTAEMNGTVEEHTLDYMLNKILPTDEAAYNKSKENNKRIVEISVIRPLNKVLKNGKYQISDTTNNRHNYPQLVRTKTASVNKYDSVNQGDTITYMITLENKSENKYNGITITDSVPNNTTFVSCTNNCNNNTPNWSNISMVAGQKTTYSYTVRVNNNVALGTEIVNNKTNVSGIKMNTITTTVNKTLTEAMKSQLIDKVNSLINNDYSDRCVSRHFIQDVYDDLGGFSNGIKLNSISAASLFNKFYTTVDSGEYTTITDGSNEYIVRNYSANYDSYYGKNPYYYVFNGYDDTSNNNEYKTMYVNGLFGGARAIGTKLEPPKHTYQYIYFDYRSLYYENNTLMVGDVIILMDKDAKEEIKAYFDETDSDTKRGLLQVADTVTMYLYLGDGKFATMYSMSAASVGSSNYSNSNRCKVTIFDNKTYRYSSNEWKQIDSSRLLSSLMGQNAFVVLRPSYAMSAPTASIATNSTLLSTGDSSNVTLTCTDATKYYWGNNANPSSSSFTNYSNPVEKTVTIGDSSKKYYLICKNGVGDISVNSVTNYKFNYMLLKTDTSYVSTNYATTSYDKVKEGYYLLHDGVASPLSSKIHIPEIPVGSSINNYKGISTGEPSDEIATLQNEITVNSESDNIYTLWFSRNYATIRYNVNGGTLTGGWNQTNDEGIILNAKGNVAAQYVRYEGNVSALYKTNSSTYINAIKNNYEIKKGFEWCTEPDGTGTCYNQSKSYGYDKFCNLLEGNCNITLYVNWRPVTYKIVLNNQGATSTGTTEVWYKYNTKVADDGTTCYFYTDSDVTSCLNNYMITKPERAGYTFGGYFTESNGEGVQYIGRSTGQFMGGLWKKKPEEINEDYTDTITLYAKWTPNVYKIVLDNQGATTNGTTAVWYKYKSSSPCYFYDDATATNCLAIGNNSYTITAPTKTGYTFGGYYTEANSNGTQYVTASSSFTNKIRNKLPNEINENYTDTITLYANWIPNTYKVVFNNQGGMTTGTTEVWYKYKTSSPCYYYIDSSTETCIPFGTTSYPKIEPPTKAGYTFAGYYTESDASGTQYITTGSYFTNSIWKNLPNEINSSYTDTVMLYAKWIPNIYHVILDNQEADNSGTIEAWYKYNTNKADNGTTCYFYTDSSATSCLANYTITMPQKDGYTFGGYYSGVNGTGIKYVGPSGKFANGLWKKQPNEINESYTDAVTLYAKWVEDTPEEFTISANNSSLDNVNRIIKRIIDGTTVETFMNGITTNGVNSTIIRNGQTLNNTDTIKTNDVLQITFNEEVYEYTLLVLKDVNADGIINKQDAIEMAKFIIDRASDIDFEYLLLGDLDNNGIISMNDVIHLLYD